MTSGRRTCAFMRLPRVMRSGSRRTCGLSGSSEDDMAAWLLLLLLVVVLRSRMIDAALAARADVGAQQQRRRMRALRCALLSRARRVDKLLYIPPSCSLYEQACSLLRFYYCAQAALQLEGQSARWLGFASRLRSEVRAACLCGA